MDVLQRFLHYVGMDTQSDPRSDAVPSTDKQKDLGRYLVDELTALGLHDVDMDDRGCVTATVPATAPGPVMGLLAHLDTSPDLTGAGVVPRVIKSYDGGVVLLNGELGVRMDPAEYTDLSLYLGQDLIVTDGTTLLGADDKAGIAEIVTMAQRLMEDPSIPHGKIRLAFTPDEEIGRGTDWFDPERFGAEFAYTVDGGTLGELEYENFNAAEADVCIRGVSIHPGAARGKMVNALLLAMEYHAMLPCFQAPQTTEGYQGFYHLNNLEGDVERADLHYIVRDHDYGLLLEKLDLMERAAQFLNAKYGLGTAHVKISHSYRNMREKLLPEYGYVVEYARKAMERLGIEPIVKPIRGGTDGAMLSWKGLPCPNLGTGGHYAHGRYEFACVQSMQRTVDLLVELARIPTEYSD